MNVTDFIKAATQFGEAAKTMPPAPVLANALMRHAAQIIIREAVRIGPSEAYFTLLANEGFDRDRALALWAMTWEDALLRSEIP